MSNLLNWTINNYTDDEWTMLVQAPAVVRALILSNTSGADVTVSVRLSNGADDERAILVPDTAISAQDAVAIDVSHISLGRSDELQIRCSAPGINAMASGEGGL